MEKIYKFEFPSWYVLQLFISPYHQHLKKLMEKMDEQIFSSSSSDSFSLISQGNQQPPLSSQLQQRLQYILKINQTDDSNWAYAIFWQTNSNGGLVLTWGDGHLNNKDVEWFYILSLAECFLAGEGVLGKSFSTGSFVWLTGGQQLLYCSCERAKEAHVHGINTLVYIPIPNGVLEMGSIDVINEDWSFIQQVKYSLFLDSDHHEIGSIPFDEKKAISLAEFGLATCLEQYGQESEINSSIIKQETRVGFKSIALSAIYTALILEMTENLIGARLYTY
ncbi:hypothetical protein HAX54_014169 [Datura stramonium]|uniref:Transcription factor n=1 Tax=Datura stramonium TaxID=4076 RepID=A0ABS8TPP2_DATST|nr:hypothetical protein [Datura stramonium]